MTKSLLTTLIILSGASAILLDLIGSDFYGIFKGITTGLILLLTFSYGNTHFPKYNKFIRLGLLCCLVGDIALLGESTFVWGLAAFLLGHFLFSEGFRSFEGLKKVTKELVVLIGLGLGALLILWKGLGEFLVPAILYIVAIIYTCWMGLKFTKTKISEKFDKVYLALVLFIGSDILVGVDRFLLENHWLCLLILPLYWGAIYLLAESTTIDSKSEEKLSTSAGI